MSGLPALSARKVVSALKRAGFVEDRQKGSHLILMHPRTKARTVIPILRPPHNSMYDIFLIPIL